MIIWHLTDGKTGHISQVKGLLNALKNQGIVFTLREVSIEHLTWQDYYRMLLSKKTAKLMLAASDEPDIIIGCGHRTHIPLILLKRAFKQVRTILLMSPSLPLCLFDIVLTPEHDRRATNDRTFVYQGVINSLYNLHQHQTQQHLILLGGPSKRHLWHDAQISEQITALLAAHPDISFTLSTSRRTPESFWEIPTIHHEQLSLNSVSDKKATTEWMYQQLHHSQVVWVTEDSLSMIYEALNAGCHVGLLALPRHREDRITAAIDELVESGRVLTLAQYLGGTPFAPTIEATEADKAAHWIIEKLHLPKGITTEGSSQ